MKNSRIRFQTNFYNEKSYEGNFTVIGNDSCQSNCAQNRSRGLFLCLLLRSITSNFWTKLKCRKLKNPLFPTPVWVLKVDGAPDGQKINLGIAALEREFAGFRRIALRSKANPIKEAKLELEAMLINDLTDLKILMFIFVVGVPRLLFQDEVSPLSLNTAFAGVSTGFRRDMGNIASNSIMTQVAGQRMGDDRNISPTSPDEEQGQDFSAEQLYLYQANQVNLKKVSGWANVCFP